MPIVDDSKRHTAQQIDHAKLRLEFGIFLGCKRWQVGISLHNALNEASACGQNMLVRWVLCTA